jgi:nucleoside-triphosphatase THEP1
LADNFIDESKNLLIYTGPIQSGKSSRLFEFYKNKKNVAGILSIVIDNKKHLYSLRTKGQKLLEVNVKENNKNTISIGKYVFYKNIFKWAREILKNDLKTNPDLIIIDEIGLLELAGTGLAPVAFEIINNSLKSRQKVAVVVRDTLVKRFLKKFALKETEVEIFSINSLK